MHGRQTDKASDRDARMHLKKKIKYDVSIDMLVLALIN